MLALFEGRVGRGNSHVRRAAGNSIEFRTATPLLFSERFDDHREILMSVRTCLIVLGVVLSFSATLRADSLEETLLGREREFVKAIQEKDQPKLKAMLADDACTVVPELGRQTGQQILERLASTTVERSSITDVKVIEVTADVGILSFKYAWAGDPGKEGERQGLFYSTSTWVKRGGEWKVIFYQQTPWSE